MKKIKKNILAIAISSALLASLTADACSRFTYTGPDNTVVTGRSLDWTEDMQTDIWVFPAGIERSGSTEPNSVKWKSKYGSIIASIYNIGAADGINSKGLNANLLYLTSTKYGAPKPDHKNLSVVNWVQYVLDNYATVDEAVKGFSKEQFNMFGPTLPNGAQPTAHLAITDPTGDNAIFEYIEGKLVIHHGKPYTVMTNEPTYDKQLALNGYWQNLKGMFLPGTTDPADRFVRASYYLSTAPQTADQQKSIAIAFSIIRNVSAPITNVVVPGRPNVSSTLWRSVADLKRNIYYFEETDRPNVFWLDMNKLDLKPDAPIKKLPLANNEVYAGEASGHLVADRPSF